MVIVPEAGGMTTCPFHQDNLRLLLLGKGLGVQPRPFPISRLIATAALFLGRKRTKHEGRIGKEPGYDLNYAVSTIQ